jgi:hypothetical protein
VLEEFKGAFGSMAIHWMVRDIHFSSAYLVFDSEAMMVRGSQILENIPLKCG